MPPIRATEDSQLKTLPRRLSRTQDNHLYKNSNIQPIGLKCDPNVLKMKDVVQNFLSNDIETSCVEEKGNIINEHFYIEFYI